MKALWSIRHLSKNTQRIYSKNLRRRAKETELNDPVKVEEYVFGLKVTNKYRMLCLMHILTIVRHVGFNGIDLRSNRSRIL